jgi:hypothetical protein
MIRQNTTRIYVSDYDSQMMPTDEITKYNGGNSQVSEPEIVNPIKNYINPSPVNSTVNFEQIEDNLSQVVPIKPTKPIKPNSITPNTNTSNPDTTNPDKESSATTDETKTYVGGGTTPDSQIVVKKPTTKYYVYGIVGIVVAYLGYKMFYKKSE